MKKELTCIVCPLGCDLVIELDGDKFVSVTGNRCKRGYSYAETEIVDPRRIITTTVKTKYGRVIPVKTNKSVPKNMILDCMKKINDLKPDAKRYCIGEIICENICGTGADIVICANIKGE